MVERMVSNRMALFGDLANQRRMTLGHRPQHEERGAGLVLCQNV